MSIIEKAHQLIMLIGYFSLISYMIVVLPLWIYTSYDGNVYFKAGEPNTAIKYIEWLLGFAGIYAAVNGAYKALLKNYLVFLNTGQG